MSTVLITGGVGFIGANFVRCWRDHNPDDTIVVLDALTYAANPASVARFEADENFELVKGNICDQALIEQILNDKDPQTIVHFAAESHVDRSINGPDPFIETNIVGTHCLLKAALKAWSEKDPDQYRFHHISTDEVFGSLKPDEPAFTETTAYAPNSTYSASKASSDHLVRAYHKTHGLPVSTSNCSNNYGPLQFPEKLIPLAITNLLMGKSIPVYGDGMNRRDWLHVGDHCEGIMKVIGQGRVGHTYNIGGNCERNNLDLVKTLCALVDDRFEHETGYADRYPMAPPANNSSCLESIEFVVDRPGHDRRYAIDAGKIRDELGFEPQHTFEDGLAETIKWYLDNSAWWQPILDGSYLKA